MAATPYTARANASGACTISISPDKSGIQWTIAQVGVESQPVRTTGTVTTRLNGNYVTSSAVLPTASSGAPAFNLQTNDKLTFDFAGLTSGDTAIVTIYYTESQWGTIPRADVV